MFYSNLINKDVINLIDGRLLGNITDLKIGSDGKIIEIKVAKRRFLFFLMKEEVISWHNITKIGRDVILVKKNDEKNYQKAWSFA